MSMPEDRSPLRDAYLARLVEFGVDLAFKDEKPKEFPNPFASGTFDPKAAKTAQRMLGAQRHYTDWRSVASEPYALFLARLSQVGKIPRSFLGAHLPAAQEVLQDEMNEVLGWLAIQSVKLPCDVFAGLYPTGELSAQISPVPGQGALLLVNVGLMDLIFSLLKINIATPAPGEKETLLTEKQATLAVVELFNAYLYGEGSLGAWPLPRLPEDRERPLGFVLRRCEQFVLCHEIGHLVLGHVAVDGPEVRHSIGAYTPSQESDADRFAVEVLIRAHQEDPLHVPRSPYLAGAIMTFFAIAETVGLLREALGLVNTGKESHPDIGARMNAIASQLNAELAQPNLLRPAEVFYSWLLTIAPDVAQVIMAINSTFKRPNPWE